MFKFCQNHASFRGALLCVMSAVSAILQSQICDADVTYGVWRFTNNDSPVNPAYTSIYGRLVTSETGDFCDAPFNPFDISLYAAGEGPTPTEQGAAPANLLSSLFNFRVSNALGDVLFQVGGLYDPLDPSYTPVRYSYATTGVSLDGAYGLNNGTLDADTDAAGGGRFLTKNFALGDSITAADFTNEATQSVLLYTEGDPSTTFGDFSSGGYVGFRLTGDDGIDYYGWMYLTNVATNGAAPDNYYGLRVQSFAMRGSATDPGILAGSLSRYASVPEPGTFCLLGFAAAAVGLRRIRSGRAARRSASERERSSGCA